MPSVGDLVPTTDHRWMTLPPQYCLNGHRLGRGRVLVGHQPCNCGGHATWRCRVCDHITYGPKLATGCRPLAGPAEVR